MSVVLTESKYRNVKVDEDGYTFDSKAEHRRYQELKQMAATRAISHLEVHPWWHLIVNEVNIGRYTADFAYWDHERDCYVVEDVKSSATKTREYRRTKKLMKAIHGIVIIEVEA